MSVAVVLLSLLVVPMASAHGRHHVPHPHHRVHRAKHPRHVVAPTEWQGTREQALAIAEQKAYELWGATPCNGAYRVELVSNERLASVEGLPAASIVSGGVSMWESPTGANVFSSPADTWTGCAMYLDAPEWELPLKDWPMLCTIVLHEWGHLTGHPHSAEAGEPPEPAPLTHEQYEVMYSRYGPEHEDIARCGERP